MEMIYPIFNDGEDKENVQKISQEEKEKRELKNKRLNNQFVNLSKLKDELVEKRERLRKELIELERVRDGSWKNLHFFREPPK